MPRVVPVWRQIREDLRAKIKAGLLKPGDRVPTTKELMEQYDASSATVRKAIDSMVDAGDLLGHQGKGVYVAEPES